ncbi:MAG: AMP-binding protein [Bacteroidetes bacterium]|nr:AMP-binding protein [Bacteroidota bacterium]
MAATFPERFAEIVVEHPRKNILEDGHGKYSSEFIFNSASFIGAELFSHRKFKGERIALLCPPGITFTAGLLAGWMSGAMVVPICKEHAVPEVEYVLKDSGAEIILCHSSMLGHLPGGLKNIIELDEKIFSGKFIPFNWDYPAAGCNALMLYTSGTTGKPKGVVHTHASVLAQVTCLVQAWEWNEVDSILHFLPLHHTHGLINKLLCALYSGAHCEMLPEFNAEKVWAKIAGRKYSLFMAVPTIYSKLISHWEKCDPTIREKYSDACRNFRLMVSGSAALPVPVLEKWKKISGHFLLERYGMTETGMVLSNSLHGKRKAGCVGVQLPGMDVRISGEGTEGELEVRGRNLFKEYWNRPEETKKSFTKDGWFRTEDMVVFEDNVFRIAGRLSTDIIKCGGYKISALEIENVLLEHAAIEECSVAGIEDETWGEKIAVALKLQTGEKEFSLEELRAWAKDKLAPYKIPSLLKFVAEIPRNSMGKALKSEVKKLFL